jgi:hypothetical protein
MTRIGRPASGAPAAVRQAGKGRSAATEKDNQMSDAITTVAGLPAERIVILLGKSAVPFSEVSAHRATLEEAYLELTRDAVEYRAELSRRPASLIAGCRRSADRRGRGHRVRWDEED